MDTERLKEIRKLVIISLFTDDKLMEVFVLKGGNAISLIHGVDVRYSQDIDVSMAEDFSKDELEDVKAKLEKALKDTFNEKDYNVFDVRLTPQPHATNNKRWGGYKLEFKIIEKEKHDKLILGKDPMGSIRRHAEPLNPRQAKIFRVDISKYEYCEVKEPAELEGLRIYVYSPVMVVYEKLRAICQQMEEYDSITPSCKRPRARDFFDIYTITKSWDTPLTLLKPENLEHLKNIFKIKEVPLNLLLKIKDYKEFHAADYQSLKDTVSSDYELREYDFYFEHVVKLAKDLKSALE